MKYTIRDAWLKDMAEIERIEGLSFSLPWTREQLLSQLNDDKQDFIVAVDENDSPLGYVGMLTVIDEAYISNVAVTPEKRRCKIADALIAELKFRAQMRQTAFISLEVRASNHSAISLYKKHGFVEVGLRKGYYRQPKEDAIIMTYYLK